MNREQWAAIRVEQLRHEGFDKTKQFKDEYFVACSGCCVLWTDGTPAHYPECKNRRNLCRECNGVIADGTSHCGECTLSLLETNAAGG